MRVIKRRKGNAEYLYLQHSFREGRKVVTREKYLGKQIPPDMGKIKAGLLRERAMKTYKNLEQIKKSFRKEWGTLPESAKENELKEIAIAFTYNTNAIEGSTITLEETREILEFNVAPNKPLRDIRETESHAGVFLGMLRTKQRLSKGLLLKWHKEMFGETKRDISGTYRNYLVRVGSYIAPHWKEIEKLMRQFLLFVGHAKLNPVELAARAHYRFEKIHPFGDGNGRIGRLIMNYILWQNGYPMLIIEQRKRMAYYKALERGEENFVRYFIRTYLSVHKNRMG